MKKIFALVLLLVLALGAFVACNQVDPTEKKVRWDTNETWTYNISLADFQSSVTTTDGTYFSNFLASGETNPLGTEVDRIVPEDLTGQYLLTVSTDVTKGLTTVTTTQTMLATYSTLNLGDTDQFETAGLVESKTSDSITLKSTTETSVVFKTGTAQTPVSSSVKVNGFYMGRQNQSVTKYQLNTEYTVESNKTNIKVTDEKGNVVHEEQIKNTNVIDSNQVLMFTRSYDKTSTSFQDNPQVLAFDALAKKARKLTFLYTASQNVLVNHTFDGETESQALATRLTRLDLRLDGLAFMTQVNLPDLTAQNLDKISAGEVFNTYFPKHTIYRFRVGFVTYELENYLTDNMANAIKVKAE